MSAYETNVHHSTDEDDYRHKAIVVASDVEHITTILHIVCCSIDMSSMLTNICPSAGAIAKFAIIFVLFFIGCKNTKKFSYYAIF